MTTSGPIFFLCITYMTSTLYIATFELHVHRSLRPVFRINEVNDWQNNFFIFDLNQLCNIFSLLFHSTIMSYYAIAFKIWLTTSGPPVLRLADLRVLISSDRPLSRFNPWYFLVYDIHCNNVIWILKKIIVLPNNTKQWYIQEPILCQDVKDCEWRRLPHTLYI